MSGGRTLRGLGLAVFASLALAPAAFADDSQVKISEVYSDGNATATGHGDYIELQLAAPGQQIPAGHSIVLWTGPSTTTTFLFPANTTLTDNQRTILFGWPDNPTADFSATGLSPLLAGGAVCLSGSSGPPVVPIDCVSWGAFSPVTSGQLGAGTPAPALNALRSLTRKKSRNCPTLLEPADDTGSSAADFSLAIPSPRNNGTNPTEAPCTAPAAPTPPTTTATTTTAKKKCKTKKHRSAESAKKKRCKKHKR
jgi:hypothetical protein